ncbi:MAG: Crp/Fnr family transcriptional regulator [Acetobacterales bacterium]
MSHTGQADWQQLLYRRLSAITDLPEAEFAHIHELVHSVHSLARDEDVREVRGTVAVVAAGWCARYRLLADGRRSVFNIWLPGDMINLTPLTPSPECQNAALRRADLVLIPDVHYRQLCERSPALVAAFAASERMDSLLLANQVLRLGRLTAYERIAHFLLEIWDRLCLVGMANEGGFESALTQNVLADVLGLTSVHINRTLARLREEELIEVDRREVRLLDVPRLAEIAEYDPIGAEAKKRIALY